MNNDVRYRRMNLRVRGRAARGDIVCYEDAANPTRVFRVEAGADRSGQYPLRNLETHTAEYSDLLQPGWHFASLYDEQNASPVA